MEYTGERISRVERAAAAKEQGRMIYLFSWTPTGRSTARRGSGAQYINHCCPYPNIRTVIQKAIFCTTSRRPSAKAKSSRSTTTSRKTSIRSVQVRRGHLPGHHQSEISPG